ncbi:MAG: hypothetical protein ABI970_19955, partial [Chloroflexota bacterium]
MPNYKVRHPRTLVTTLVILVAVMFAVSLSVAIPSQAADENTATPNANENLATAQRSADEAKSLYWAASARLLQKENDPFTALALALEANRIP